MSLVKRLKELASQKSPHQTEEVQMGAFPRGFALPAAMHRMAKRYDMGAYTNEQAIKQEYGSAPGAESLTMLGEALGTSLHIKKIDILRLKSADLPVIAVTKEGGAVVLQSRGVGHFVVEGEDDTQKVQIDTALSHLSGTILDTELGESAIRASLPNSTRWLKPVQTLMEKGSVLRWLTDLLWQHNRKEMSLLLLAGCLSNLFLIALPLFIMSVYDKVIPHSAYESLQTLAVGILIVLSADMGLRYAKLKFVDAIGLSLSRRLQMTLYRQLLRVRLTHRPKTATPLTQHHSELETVCVQLPEFLNALVADSLFAICVLALIAYLGGPVVFAPIAGCFLVGALIAGSAIKARVDATQAVMLRSAAAGQINETFESLTAVKAAGAEHQLLKRFERLGELAAVKGHQTRQRLRAATQGTGILVQATVVATLCLGVARIDAGLMTIGSLAAITILVGRAVTPIGQLVDQGCRLWTLKDVLRATFDEVKDEENQGGDAGGINTRSFQGAFQLNDVSFVYEATDVTALSSISMSIAPGEKIGLIGQNGSGKSTLLHLFPGLLTPQNGAILIDRHDARQYTPHFLRSHVGFMPQETVLFNQSLKDNICLGQEDVSLEDFERAVTLSGVDRFARTHPSGYSMDVGPRGEFLSAGQRQAVGLARLLIRPRSVLVLDEPTSLLDHTAEAHVISGLKDYLRDKTLIVSTHRLRLLELVDRVITLDGGKVIADGPKQQVLAQLQSRTAPQPKTQTQVAQSG
ncbi:MAG: ATP-binding cassette domain-containing protein [Pseudomonadota bacterium]